jgi:hypothetical protein
MPLALPRFPGSDIQLRVYGGKREIQAVAGSIDMRHPELCPVRVKLGR